VHDPLRKTTWSPGAKQTEMGAVNRYSVRSTETEYQLN